MRDFICPDCGRPWLSISAVMACPCDRYDKRGLPKHVKGDQWLP